MKNPASTLQMTISDGCSKYPDLPRSCEKWLILTFSQKMDQCCDKPIQHFLRSVGFFVAIPIQGNFLGGFDQLHYDGTLKGE